MLAHELLVIDNVYKTGKRLSILSTHLKRIMTLLNMHGTQVSSGNKQWSIEQCEGLNAEVDTMSDSNKIRL